MFIVQLCCIMVMIYCILIVLWSLRRNWGGIQETCKELLTRELKDMRRPILAVLSIIASVTLSIQAKVISMKKVPQFDIDKQEDIITHVSLCLSSALLTPVSLGFISNPKTVSIRKGFKKAGENLIKRIKGWGCHFKSCMTNNMNNDREDIEVPTPVNEEHIRNRTEDNTDSNTAETSSMLPVREDV